MSTTLTPTQQRQIERARALLDAAEHMDPAVLAGEIEAQTGHTPYGDAPYPEAFGLARVRLEDLLTIIGDLTGGAS